ncbi:MAG: YebC/PmpR family DNA-binding transcriptional regulator [Puniceicoccales bacterium]|jgi:YebC/PmpR family DNA-binding regulatory protein|nr:YebC/PmpR family DNA-binding transcriptional regulator [Puniceicoccales bacterium]
MSGHSKWATTKRHKAAVDAKRGKLFSILSKELTIAARASGGDQEFNPRLRTIVQKAKAANMPADNVKKAIQKGTGEIPGIIIEELMYEGYAPCGVGVIVEVTTDNKNRTVSEVRSIFTKCGGNLASPGALAFNFQRMGQFIVPADNVTEDKLMDIAINAGAEDVKKEEDFFEILCPVSEYDKLSQALIEENIAVESSELAYIPNNYIQIPDVDIAKKIVKLLDKLDELEDVRMVFSNHDFPNEVSNQLED